MPNHFGLSVAQLFAADGSLEVFTLNTAVAHTLVSANANKYYLLNGGNVSITLPLNAPQGGFLCFRNQTAAAISFTNLALSIPANSSLVLVFNAFIWVPL